MTRVTFAAGGGNYTNCEGWRCRGAAAAMVANAPSGDIGIVPGSGPSSGSAVRRYGFDRCRLVADLSARA